MDKKSLEKFNKLYRERFGEDLSDTETLKKATALINLYLAVYGQPLEGAGNQWENEADNSRNMP